MEETAGTTGSPGMQGRMPPRRAALLIAAVAGTSAGALTSASFLIVELWPDRYGGDHTGIFVVEVLLPLMLLVQTSILAPLFRWTGLRQEEPFRGMKASSHDDTVFVISLIGLVLATTAATFAGPIALMLGNSWAHVPSAFRFLPLPLLLTALSWIFASAAAHPLPETDRAPEAIELDLWLNRVRPIRLYLAWLANMFLAGPLLVWLATDLLLLPAGPGIAALAGSSLGTVVGISVWGRSTTDLRMLIRTLLAADLAAASFALPVAGALDAYAIPGESWLAALVVVANFVGLAALAGLSMKRVLRRTG